MLLDLIQPETQEDHLVGMGGEKDADAAAQIFCSGAEEVAALPLFQQIEGDPGLSGTGAGKDFGLSQGGGNRGGAVLEYIGAGQFGDLGRDWLPALQVMGNQGDQRFG